MSDKQRLPTLLFSLLTFGYAFLYLPIAVLMAWSFNASRLVTVWGGFSTKWYVQLLHDEKFLNAALLSLKIAVVSASVALMLGTLAAMALVRFGNFPGRKLFNVLIAAPMVMPEIIMGLALLLMFVALEQLIGWPEGRGFATIVLSHATVSTAYVTVVVRSRLSQLDMSIEEAALDLGARPVKVFFVITLPMLIPALAAGWLLAFTLSLDDVVVTQFVSGPGSTTLPITVFSSIRLGVSPEINALGTIIIALVATVIVLAGWLMRGKKTGS